MANFDQINDFRAQTGLTVEHVTDADLETFLTANGGLIPETAVAVLDRLATESAALVDMTESGSSRSLGSLHRQFKDMAAHWSEKASVPSQRMARVSTAIRV